MSIEQDVYLIIRQGVYRHEILGVYSDKKKAEERCRDVKAKEKDDYHSIELCCATLNHPIRDVIVMGELV